MKKIRVLFQHEKKEIIEKAERLYEALIHLRYEGKVSFYKNIHALKGAAMKLEKAFSKHQNFQEHILFPFLEGHIPKYEKRIRILRSDHRALEKDVQRLKESTEGLAKKMNGHTICIQQIKNKGIFLVCFLRHHFQLEEQGIIKALKKDLNRSEIKEIRQKVEKWLAP